ncbi:hypothetical protein XI03_02720 [Bradyrhizobium sp. CCBAU 65884]|nr:hypothetical protein [Bradyrhizobium sp. CCBAU 65884]
MQLIRPAQRVSVITSKRTYRFDDDKIVLWNLRELIKQLVEFIYRVFYNYEAFAVVISRKLKRRLKPWSAEDTWVYTVWDSIVVTVRENRNAGCNFIAQRKEVHV